MREQDIIAALALEAFQIRLNEDPSTMSIPGKVPAKEEYQRLQKPRHQRNCKLKGKLLKNFMHLNTTPAGIYKPDMLSSMCNILEAF